MKFGICRPQGGHGPLAELSVLTLTSNSNLNAPILPTTTVNKPPRKFRWDATPHMALDDNAPIPREVEPPERGKVVATPYLGGLHHRYSRAA